MYNMNAVAKHYPLLQHQSSPFMLVMKLFLLHFDRHFVCCWSKTSLFTLKPNSVRYFMSLFYMFLCVLGNESWIHQRSAHHLVKRERLLWDSRYDGRIQLCHFFITALQNLTKCGVPDLIIIHNINYAYSTLQVHKTAERRMSASGSEK